MDAESTPPPKSSCVYAALRQIRALDFRRRPSPQDYPPISSVPRTSASRLDRAAPKHAPERPISSASPQAASYLSDPSSSTVLYLAYGSNLSAETFLGVRGIRPISTLNVSAPSLRLTFDLPGLAYKEPCFANTAPRKIPKPPKLPPGVPDPPEIPHPPPGFTFPPPSVDVVRSEAHGDPTWDKGLIGVVYEVTPEDYATIVKTEGGGASYKDILVPCIAIPKAPPGIPERPPVPELPRPFLAHTLYAPRIPKNPGDGDRDGNDGDDLKYTRRINGDGGGGGGDDDDGDDDGGGDSPIDRLKNWWRNMLLRPIRPDPEYAQPSARYLKLITDGAAEHDLPVEYQRWLASLQPYTITSRWQALGQFLFLGLVAPVLLFYLALCRILADGEGRVPVWFGLGMETFFHLEWTVYDRLFQPIFGDGERTVEEEKDGRQKMLRRGKVGSDEEKAGLLNRRDW